MMAEEDLRMSRLVSILLLIYSYFLIRTHLPKLPARIPTHFNSAGVADGWGSPGSLWLILGAQALTCAIFLVVPLLGQRYPDTVHLGLRRLSDFPAPERAGILTMVNQMAGYLNVVLNLFFVFMLREIIRAAEQPARHLQVFWPVVLAMGGTAAILWYYLAKFRKLGKGEGGTSTRVTP